MASGAQRGTSADDRAACGTAAEHVIGFFWDPHSFVLTGLLASLLPFHAALQEAHRRH